MRNRTRRLRSCPEPSPDILFLGFLDRVPVRFTSRQMLGLVVLVALGLAIARHPETLWAAVVPLVGGLFVVLPTLGLIEWLTPRSSNGADIGWLGAIAGMIVALVGAVAGALVLMMLLAEFG